MSVRIARLEVGYQMTSIERKNCILAKGLGVTRLKSFVYVAIRYAQHIHDSQLDFANEALVKYLT